MKIVFVTGGTGFLGGHLLHRLIEKGYHVRALYRSIPNSKILQGIADKIEWIKGDLHDLDALEKGMSGADEVYHSAAVVSFHAEDKEDMFAINQHGTANVVNMALSTGVGRFLHVSSIAALGRKPGSIHVDEDTIFEKNETNTNYALSKFYGELEVWRGIAEGLNAVIANPSIIIGPGNFWDKGTGVMVTKVWNGLSFYPTGRSGWVDVRDVAQGMILLMEGGISGQKFILSAENLPFKTVLEDIALGLGKRRPNRPVTPFLGRLALMGDAFRAFITRSRALITKEALDNTYHQFEYDNRKFLEAFPEFRFNLVQKTVIDMTKDFLDTKN